MTYKTEFPPEYWPTDAEVAALEAAGFVDTSWHNNVAPSWAMPTANDNGHMDCCVEIYCDAANPALREIPGPRFTVVGYNDGCPEPINSDIDNDACFDSLQEAIDAATDYAADIFHTVNR